MKSPATPPPARGASVLLGAASLSYTANCLLGTAVATRTVDTTDARWTHHALYTATSVLTVSAAGALLLSPVSTHKRAGALLLPALVPLGLIPFLGSVAARRGRHTVVALTAAPFFAMSAAALLGKPGGT
jgi:ABC-type Na+ efflux pump permease subunit